MIKKIYLSIENGGDGSAWATYFEDEECAFLHQTLKEEGWGEPCVQELVMSSDSEISINNRVMSRQGFIDKLQQEVEDSWVPEDRKTQFRNAIKLLNKTMK